jgi:hypothetical protein
MNKLIAICAALVLATTSTGLADLGDGLVAYYPFNGNANDESGNGNNATVHGASLIEDRFGNFNSAYSFDGLDDYIDIGNNVKPPFPITVSVWVRMIGPSSIFRNDQVDHSAYRYGIRIGLRSDGTLVSHVMNGFSGPTHRVAKVSDDTVAMGEDWHHYTVIFHSLRNHQLFWDGQELDGTYYGTGNSLMYSDANGAIGMDYTHASDGGQIWLDGSLDDIRVYNRALDGAEVQELYNSANQIPVADAGGPYLVAVEQTIALDGSGSYDEDGDPLEYLWTQKDTLGSFDDSSSKNPNYTGSQAGITDLTLTVSDGQEDDFDNTMLVVYEPSGSFVTGGGWIWSPAGAYADDLLLEGKANFGFISKYKKGAQVPTGNTEFVFHAADLNFHSNSYDWLVVTGSNYARFKGVGTINGSGAYKFMLWAGDAPDTFRIKIWWEDGEIENVVYDNGMDQTIGGGSIVIHTK